MMIRTECLMSKTDASECIVDSGELRKWTPKEWEAAVTHLLVCRKEIFECLPCIHIQTHVELERSMTEHNDGWRKLCRLSRKERIELYTLMSQWSRNLELQAT